MTNNSLNLKPFPLAERRHFSGGPGVGTFGPSYAPLAAQAPRPARLGHFPIEKFDGIFIVPIAFCNENSIEFFDGRRKGEEAPGRSRTAPGQNQPESIRILTGPSALAVPADSGKFWLILADFGRIWRILVESGRIWPTLDDSGYQEFAKIGTALRNVVPHSNSN